MNCDSREEFTNRGTRWHGCGFVLFNSRRFQTRMDLLSPEKTCTKSDSVINRRSDAFCSYLRKILWIVPGHRTVPEGYSTPKHVNRMAHCKLEVSILRRMPILMWPISFSHPWQFCTWQKRRGPFYFCECKKDVAKRMPNVMQIKRYAFLFMYIFVDG